MAENNLTALENSKYYIAIITKYFVEDAKSNAELMYAKELKKPAILIIDGTIELPDKFLDGLNIIYTGIFKDEKDVDKIINEVADIFIKIKQGYSNG